MLCDKLSEESLLPVCCTAHAMPILTDKQLRRIKDHRYSRPDKYSIVEDFLDGFWEWTVAKVPTWWAPNSMTLLGLLANLLSSAAIFYYNIDGKNVVPSCIYIASAAGVFAYQVLDAIDGKQARRTGSGSPVGELLDHGCDSVSTVFLALAFCLTVGFTSSPNLLFFMVFGAMFLFYLAHWQAYVTGAMRFGRFDAIELQCLVIMAYLLTALFGEWLWNAKIPLVPFATLRNVIFAGLCIGGAFNIFENFCIIFMQGGVGRNGSTVAGTSVLFPIVPIATVILAALTISKKSRVLFVDNICIYVLMFGMVFVKVTLNMIVAYMTKSALLYMDSIYVGPGLLFVNQYFNCVLNEYYVLCIALVYCVVDVSYYSCALISQISSYMGICIFSCSSSQTTAGATSASS